MSNDHQSLESLGLPPIDQVGFVVLDLEDSIKRYEPIFGPFTRMDGSVSQATYRGQVADVELDIGFGHSGDVEMEFIQWKSGASPHREFIEQGREGLHHLRYRVDQADAWIEKLSQVQYFPIWYKVFSEDITFAYLEREGDPLLLEVLQMP